MGRIYKLRSGFTRIQFLITIFVIGIVVGFVFFIFDPLAQIKNANDVKRKIDIKQIQSLLDKYYKDFGKYPQNASDCLKNANYCKMVRLDGTAVEWGESFKPYTERLPKDPSGKIYIYYVTPNRQSYYLYASLDNIQDKELCNGGSMCLSLKTNGFKDESLCKGICNYGASSPNVSP